MRVGRGRDLFCLCQGEVELVTGRQREVCLRNIAERVLQEIGELHIASLRRGARVRDYGEGLLHRVGGKRCEPRLIHGVRLGRGRDMNGRSTYSAASILSKVACACSKKSYTILLLKSRSSSSSSISRICEKVAWSTISPDGSGRPPASLWEIQKNQWSVP